MTTTTSRRHRQGSLRDQVRDAMAMHEIDVALAAIATARRAASASLELTDPVADAVAALLDGAGADALAGLGHSIREQEESHSEHLMHLRGLDQVAARLHSEARERQRESADRGFAVLRDELDKVLDAAAKNAAALGDRTDPEAAIAAGVADDWQQLRTLADKHIEIRLLQTFIASGMLDAEDVPPVRASIRPLREFASRATRQLILTHGTVRDFAQRFPAGYISREELPEGTNITVQVMNVPDPTELPWDTGNPVVDLVWLATHRDVVWLPPAAELLAARTADVEAKRAAREQAFDQADRAARAHTQQRLRDMRISP